MTWDQLTDCGPSTIIGSNRRQYYSKAMVCLCEPQALYWRWKGERADYFILMKQFTQLWHLSEPNREGDGTPLQYSCLEKSHGRRNLVGCSPWGPEESDTTERLHFHFSLLCIGEGNGNPLQCSCLENPRDGEPGGLPSMGPYKVGHDCSDLAAAAAVNTKSAEEFSKLETWEIVAV